MKVSLRTGKKKTCQDNVSGIYVKIRQFTEFVKRYNQSQFSKETNFLANNKLQWDNKDRTAKT